MSPDARRYLIALGILVVFGAVAHAVRVNRVPEAIYQPDFSAIPRQVGEYQGRDVPVDESIYKFLAAAGILERVYEGPGGAVRLTVIYAPDWRSIHSPAGCFPAQGWEVITDDEVTYSPPPDSPVQKPLKARLIRLHKDDHWLLALFSFAYYGGTTSNWAEEGYRVAFGPRGAGGLVITLNTPVQPNLRAAAERISHIFVETYPAAISFWYEGDTAGEDPAVELPAD